MIGVLAVAVLGGLGTVLASSLIHSPAKTFVSYQKEFLMDSAMPHVVALVEEYNTLVSLSTDMTLTADCKESYFDQCFEDSSISLKIDLSQDNILLNADL